MAAISMSSWPKLRTAQSEVSGTSISPRLPDRAEMQSTHRAGPTSGSDVRDLTRQLLHSGCPEQLQAAMSMLFIQIAVFSHEDDRPVRGDLSGFIRLRVAIHTKRAVMEIEGQSLGSPGKRYALYRSYQVATSV
ncbi:hypothetical protein AK812_SmicGene44748 [Symbiodinium microadriaticum]|uniref:Uncharacterized protein n=1 Tax=Symbiodinium microadriaticum TaxID=2951 RepID=A0A1Q9BXL9_SYMMI|nr:hypothetical protein AK812_SmicGene44748 [Symbiodinium microadriaticum]